MNGVEEQQQDLVDGGRAIRLSVGTAQTLPAVLEEQASNEGGERPLLLRDGRVVATYASFRASTRRLAPRLASVLATEEGSVRDMVAVDDSGRSMRRPIAVLCANGPPLLELCMAAWYIRRPVLLLPTSATLDIIADLINLAEPLVLFHGGPGGLGRNSGHSEGAEEEEQQMRTALTEQMETLASTISQRCPQLKLVAVTDDRLASTVAAEDEGSTTFAYEQREGEEDEVCCVLSTSASTTGTSVKAVPLTHTNLLYSCVSRNHLWSGHIDDGDRVLGWLPMFHIMGLLLDFLNSALYCGGSYAFCPLSADLPRALIRGIQVHRPTLLSTVPWMLAEWRKRIEASAAKEGEETLEALRSLKALLTGGAPIADDLALFFETRGVRLFQSEGMTECSGSLFTGHPSDTSFRTLRMHPSIAYEWLPVDPGLIEGSDGGGELVIVDSPSVTPGYLKNAAANAKAFYWAQPVGAAPTAAVVRKFRTGDVFRVLPGTQGRCVEYVCRVDDLLSLSTGEKMNPIAFEQRLRLYAVAGAAPTELPLVHNVCLIGRGMPIAFAVIEPDYAAVDQAFAAAAAQSTVEAWLEGALWRAVAKVNEGWNAACRVHRAAIVVLGRHDEPLPVSRKKLVYRVLAEKRFADELKARTALILGSSPTSAMKPDAERNERTASQLGSRRTETLAALRECLAQVLAVPIASLSSATLEAGAGGVDDQPFASLGLTSLLAARLAGQVTERFGVDITAATLYTHITLDQLATFVLTSRTGATTLEQPSAAPRGSESSTTTEPVAITGMSCRFPGGADDLESYWALLKGGVDGITEVPRSRWDIDQLYDPDSDAPGKMHTRRGGFVEATERFDHRFFGISAHEAKTMDPRQRVALELVWEALESAGIPPRSLAGSRTGVFVALMDSPFQETLLAVGPPDLQYGTGGSSSVVAGRLSHFFKLRGPSMTVDTACSSSLVAIDAAARAIRSGQCAKAIVCAAHAVLTPTSSVFLSKARMISPNGRCATFDADADGYCRSEGYGAVVLERLRDAEASARPVWGVLCGSAVNHNGGTSNGITAPSTLAQREVLAAALADAGHLDPARVSLIEAHGTGTPVGDPIEMAALVDVYGKPRWRAQQRAYGGQLAALAVASVKTNIGHAEPSSGIAGVIKVLLAMRHGVIPPHIHLKKLNPLIDLRPAEASLYIPTAPVPWRPDSPEAQLFAGVSSLGFAGTNAHVILASPPRSATAASASDRWTGPFVLPFSATNAESLLGLAQRLLRHCERAIGGDNDSDADALRRSAAELCLTAALGRTHFDIRAAVVGRDIAELAAALRAWIASAEAGRNPAAPPVSRHRAAARPRVCFVLAGQGSQYVGMGRQLYESCQVFRQALDECDAVWREVNDTLLPRRVEATDLPTVAASLVSLIYPTTDDSRDEAEAALDRTANSQPALLAFEYALARQWQAWGVEPVALTGHSLGEIVAAVLAGLLSLREGLALVASRGWWMQRCPGGGAMAAVFAPREQVEALIAQTKRADTDDTGRVLVLAAVNGPTSVVVSGDQRSVTNLLALAEAADVKARALDNVHSAFHSPLLSGAVDRWAAEAEACHIFAPSTGDDNDSRAPEVVSTTTTSALSRRAARSMPHWRQHAIEAVLLWPAVASLLSARSQSDEPITALLEIGPSSILTSQIRRALPTLTTSAATKTVASLVKGRDSRASMFDALAQLYAAGVEVDWAAVYADLRRASPDLRMIAAPTYAFLPTHCWAGPALVAGSRGTGLAPETSTPVAAARSWSPLDRPNMKYVDWAWDSTNDAELVPLRQHEFGGRAVLPAAAMLGLLASTSLAGGGIAGSSHALAGVVRLSVLSRVEIPLTPATGGVTTIPSLRLQLAYDADKAGAFDLYLVSRPGDAPVKCAAGQLVVGADVAQRSLAPTLAYAKALCQRNIDVGLLYDNLHAGGLHYGPLFRCVRALWAAANSESESELPSPLLSRIQVPEDPMAPSTSAVPPAWVVDACLHTAGGFFLEDEPRRTFLPIEFEGFHLQHPFTATPGQSLWCLHQRVLPAASEDHDATLNTVQVTVFADDGQVLLTIDKYTSKEVRPESAAGRLVYDITWEELPLGRGTDVEPRTSIEPEPSAILLAFADSQGTCRSALDEMQRSRPTRCVQLRQAAEFAVRSSARESPSLEIDLRPDASEDYSAALAAIFGHFSGSLAQATPVHVLFGWALDIGVGPDADVDLFAASARASGSALLLLQALAAESLHPETSIVFLTRDAAAVSSAVVGDTLDLTRVAAASAQASLQGLAAVAATELPDVNITVVDLDTDQSSGSAQTLARVLLHGAQKNSILGAEDRLTIRDGRLYAPRLTRPSLPAQPSAASSGENQTVLITGAFGGVGREICRRMLAAGAADHHRAALFLVGRHPPADPAAWVAELMEPRPAESLPAPVQHSAGVAQLRLPGGPDLWFCRADVSLSTEVDALFTAMVEVTSAPGGTTTQLEVHHCAGLLRDGVLMDLAWESFAAVMAPKAVGAFNLLRGCQRHNLALRSFALCSSITNVVGTAGQANYAAVNSMVECMAAHCRRGGLPVRAVCWGLWRDIGMASSTKKESKRSASAVVNSGGVRVLPMEAADALGALELLDTSAHHSTVVIADVAWSRQQSAGRPARVSLWKRFTSDHASPAPAAAADRSGPAAEPAAMTIEARLHGLVCEVLALGHDTAIADDLLLAELGFDSMSGMELRGALARDVGLWLPLKTFRSPTKASILAAYHKTAATTQPTPTAAVSTSTSRLPAVDTVITSSSSTSNTALSSKWLDFIGGNVKTATLRVVCFGDAGGDPANFKSWLSIIDTTRIEVWALHLPHHTTRATEDPCPSLPAAAAAFMAEVSPFLADKPYALFGQCIGAYYALRFTEEMRNALRRSDDVAMVTGGDVAPVVTLPVAILASACPGPSDLEVLTTYTRRPTMYEGLKALSLAIGWSEEEWERFAGNATLYAALVADVSMAGMECGLTEADPLEVPITALLGELDPVVKRRHVASWMGVTSRSFALEWLPGQGHNMQFEPPLVECVNRALLRLADSVSLPDR